MFSLVKFENGEYSVLPSKRVKVTGGKDCIVKVKNGAKYFAHLLHTADAEKKLISKMNRQKNDALAAESTIEEDTQKKRGTKATSHLTNFKKRVKISTGKKTNKKIFGKKADILLNKDVITPQTDDAENQMFNMQDNVVELHEKTVESLISDDGVNLNLLQEQEKNEFDAVQSSDVIIPQINETSPNPCLPEDEEQNNISLMPTGDDVKKVTFSTPVDEEKDNFVPLNMSDINLDGSYVPETPESSAPSGFTAILDEFGHDIFKSTLNIMECSDPPLESNELEMTMLIPLNNHEVNTLNMEIGKLNDCDVGIPSDHEEPIDNNAEVLATKNTQESLSNDHGESEHDDTDPKDPNYSPEETFNNTRSTNNSTRSVSRINISSFDETPALDVRNLEVPASRIYNKRNIKKHFCIYCKKLLSKFARHLIMKHNTEADVKKFLTYPKLHPERRHIIDSIRKKGDFEHNLKAEYNTGILIPSRQRQDKYKNTAEDYICCKTCQGFYSKKTIRIHSNKCDKNHKRGVRYITTGGRRMTGYIHAKANRVLRRVVFPVLRDDEVTRSIKYDELIIMYANKLCDKYTLDHQHDMIRAHLRLLGRFKLTMMDLDAEVTDFASIITPKRFDLIVEAIRIVAHWDENIKWFKTPAVAQSLTTLLKKVAKKYRSLNIRAEQEDDANIKKIDNFLLLWEEEIPILISKKALEDQVLQKRTKKVLLPTKQDIKVLFEYLKKKAAIAYKTLLSNFDPAAWSSLNEYTLILIQIFNRRRAGEMERLKLKDFTNRDGLDEKKNADICAKLSPETVSFARQYVRLTLRGKVNRTVSVLLSPFVLRYVEILLQYRKDAGVRSDNDYVFAVPNTTTLKKKYIRACPLMRKFSVDCGAAIPEALRGTNLRKHIATYTAMLDVEETQVDRLARFLGHHKDIHKDIYRVPVPVAEITDVSRLLVAAMGDDEEEDGTDDSGDEQRHEDEGERRGNINDPNEYLEPEENGTNDTSHSVNDQNNDDDESDVSEYEPSTSRRKSSTYSRKRARVTNSSGEVKRRSTSPYGKTKRKYCTESEKAAVIRHFGKLEDLKRLPTSSECLHAIKQRKALSHRRPEQLRVYINNQRSAEKRRVYYANKKKN